MVRALLVLAPLALGLLASAPSEAADAGAPTGLPSCVQVATESRYVPYGYNHIVHVRNACTQAAACVISTDVNPEAQRVEVAAASTADVTTFMGANASAFVAKVSCTLR